MASDGGDSVELRRSRGAGEMALLFVTFTFAPPMVRFEMLPAFGRPARISSRAYSNPDSAAYRACLDFNP